MGRVTVRVPSSNVDTETESADGIEVVVIESTVRGASVLVTQFVGFVTLLQSLGMADDDINTAILEGMVADFTAEFIRESGGRVRGHRQGQFSGLGFYSAFGETDLNDATFEVRGFVSGGDIYFVMLLWNDDSADIVEPFFESVSFR